MCVTPLTFQSISYLKLYFTFYFYLSDFQGKGWGGTLHNLFNKNIVNWI